MQLRVLRMPFSYLMVIVVLIICITSSGCSAVFDLNTEDIEVIDYRRSLTGLWYSPEGFYVNSGEEGVVVIGAWNYSQPSNYTGLDPADALLPFVHGLDGKLYWPTLARDNERTELRVYDAQSLELVRDIAAQNGRGFFSPEMFMVWNYSKPPTIPGRVVLSTLGRPLQQEYIPARNVAANERTDALISFDPDAMPRKLLVIRPRPPDRLVRIELDWPVGAGMRRSYYGLQFGYNADLDSLFYHDEKGELWIYPLEAGPPINLGLVEIVQEGRDNILYVDDQKRLFIYSMRHQTSVSLGITRDMFGFENYFVLRSRWLLACGSQGLFSLSLEPFASPIPLRQLDVHECRDVLELDEHRVRYRARIYSESADTGQRGAGLVEYTAPLDGSESPEPVSTADLPREGIFEIARCGNGLRAYSINVKKPNPYTRQFGDGWVNGWRFSEEAYEVAFSRDCRRIRWKEHRDSKGVGEIFSAEIMSNTRLRLARNADSFSELSDGRVLTRSNLIGLVDEVRYLLIDEDARQAYWLLDGSVHAVMAKLIAPLNELLLALPYEDNLEDHADVRTWVRLPVPPRQ